MCMPDRFNDTIERMDYMIEHGRRIAEAQRSAKKTPAPSPLLQSHNTNYSCSPSALQEPVYSSFATKPLAKQHLFGTPVASNSPILKAKSTNSPAKTKNTFKKPMPIKFLTPGIMRKPSPMGASRIPKPVSAGKVNHYDYVKSPIGAYISKTAPNPMQLNINPERDFLDSTYCAGASKALDFTLPTGSEAEPTRRYPKTVYIAAPKDKVS